MSEKVWCEFLKDRAFLIQKDEALERYKRSSEGFAPVVALCVKPYGARGITSTGVYPNPIYLKSYLLGAMIWLLHTDANYRVITVAPVRTHTIMNTKNFRLVRIAFVVPFVYPRIQRFLHAMQTEQTPSRETRKGVRVFATYAADRRIRLLAERRDGAGFVVLHVKDGVELGDL